MRWAALALAGLVLASCAGEAVPPAPGPVVSPGRSPEVLITPRVAAPEPRRPRYRRAAYHRGYLMRAPS